MREPREVTPEVSEELWQATSPGRKTEHFYLYALGSFAVLVISRTTGKIQLAKASIAEALINMSKLEAEEGLSNG
jgi:hypothetical protein